MLYIEFYMFDMFSKKLRLESISRKEMDDILKCSMALKEAERGKP